MSFQLVLDNGELVLPLRLEGEAHDRLLNMLERAAGDHAERAAIAQRITAAILESLGCELEAPTDKQIKYAVAIAKTLSLHLAPEVLKHRSAMNAFLTQNATLYRQRKSRT